MHNMSALGAVTALFLMHGITIAPLDPLFLYFCIHGCRDIEMIHPALLTEWHPKHKQIITDWITAGPGVNAKAFQDYFTTCHDLQVSYMISSEHALQVARLQDCDQNIHDAIAVQMLFRVVMGSEPPNYPEIQAFRAQIQLTLQ